MLANGECVLIMRWSWGGRDNSEYIADAKTNVVYMCQYTETGPRRFKKGVIFCLHTQLLLDGLGSNPTPGNDTTIEILTGSNIAKDFTMIIVLLHHVH